MAFSSKFKRIRTSEPVQCIPLIASSKHQAKLPTKPLKGEFRIGSIDWKDESITTTTEPRTSILWEESARPAQLSDVRGQDAAKTVLLAWIDAPITKAVLLCAQTSCGKSSLARTVFESRSYRIWDESMLGEDDTLSNALDMLMSRPPLIGTHKRAVLIECAEGIFGDERTKLIKVLKSIKIPVIITCDDPYDQSLKSLKDACLLVQLKPLDTFVAKSILIKAANTIGKPLSSDSAETLLEAAHGNVRQALNSMQFMIQTKNRTKLDEPSALKESDKSWDLFSSSARVCSGMGGEGAEDIASSDLDLALTMLHHNLPSSARSMASTMIAEEALSFSDILLHRHYSDLASFIGVRSVAEACKGPQRCPRMQFPSYFGKMSSLRGRANALRIIGAGKTPTVGQLLTSGTKHQSIQSSPLAPSTTLDMVHPQAFESHEILEVRKALQESSCLKPKAMREAGLLLDNASANELIKKGLW